MIVSRRYGAHARLTQHRLILSPIWGNTHVPSCLSYRSNLGMDNWIGPKPYNGGYFSTMLGLTVINVNNSVSYCPAPNAVREIYGISNHIKRYNKICSRLIIIHHVNYGYKNTLTLKNNKSSAVLALHWLMGAKGKTKPQKHIMNVNWEVTVVMGDTYTLFFSRAWQTGQ